MNEPVDHWATVVAQHHEIDRLRAELADEQEACAVAKANWLEQSTRNREAEARLAAVIALCKHRTNLDGTAGPNYVHVDTVRAAAMGETK